MNWININIKNNNNNYLKESVIVDDPNAGSPIEWDAHDGDGCVDLVDSAHLGGVPAREIPAQNGLKSDPKQFLFHNSFHDFD
jgi:hypothetical protein